MTTEIEAEAHGIVETYNAAIPSHSTDLEWFGMHHERETGEEYFVFETRDYLDPKGLAALRDKGRYVHYVEAFHMDGVDSVQVEYRVRNS